MTNSEVDSGALARDLRKRAANMVAAAEVMRSPSAREAILKRALTFQECAEEIERAAAHLKPVALDTGLGT